MVILVTGVTCLAIGVFIGMFLSIAMLVAFSEEDEE